jgi:malate dehydrogenase
MNLDKEFIITITGASGNIGSSLVFLLFKENIFENNSNITLRMVDLATTKDFMEGVKMELEDCNFENLKNIEIHQDSIEAFENSDLIIIAGAKPRGPGMKRIDLLEINVLLIMKQAKYINESCDPDKKQTRILMVSNPCNTLSTVFCHFAPKIPKTSVTFLSCLDQNRAYSNISHKIKVPVNQIKNIVVLGNHSSTMLVDISRAYYYESLERTKVKLVDVLDKDYVKKELQEAVKTRGEEIINKKLKSSSFSASNAIIGCLKNWYQGSNGETVSFGIFCSNLFDKYENIFVSMPVVCKNGGFQEIENYFDNFDEENLVLFKNSLEELSFEKELAMDILENYGEII